MLAKDLFKFVCTLFWLVTVFHDTYGEDGERTNSRRRGRHRGIAAFRTDEINSSSGIDPLFTDQREIRLSFMKHRLWSEQTSTVNSAAKKKSRKKPPKLPLKEDYGGRKETSKRPNIILILTDDQDIELGSLEFMPKTRSILKEGGAFFPNTFVSTPMCCPSRSTLLTGLFVHNHGVLTNNDNCSSAHWQAEHEPRTFGAYLASSGYRTGYFGKYLNKYNGSYIPPGWREWAGQVMNSRYYNYTINVNGQKIKHGFDYQQDYYPDLITNDSISFLRQSKLLYDHQPFLLVMSFPAPHGPEDSAPQFSDMFFNITRHRTPSYDFAPNPDKQWILRWLGKMEPVHQKFTDLLMTKRLQTLQSVDDSVDRIYRELASLGQLDNTYIFYTSDHGYHLGQFGLIKGKSFPFEFDIRVPFLVRGPGISRGRVVHNMIGNVDLAPTFLDIAGLNVPSHMDGSSIFRFLQKKKTKNSAPWRDTYLIERGKIPPSSQPKLNVVEDVPPNNEGAEGDDGDGVSIEYSSPRGKFERWAIECRKPQYQSPCKGYQKYECVFVNDRWKMKKCRADIPVKRRWCKCKALSKYRLSRLEREERRMQRAFLKEHVSADWRDYRPRFLKTVAGSGRYKRKAEVEAEDGSVLRDVAEDELEQVELIMEEISDDILDLEALRNTNGGNESEPISNVVKEVTSTVGPARDERLNCQVWGQNRINCSSEVYSDPEQWRLNRDYIEQQIRILRTQLDEMKVIRKHLREIKPPEKIDILPTTPSPLSTSRKSKKVEITAATEASAIDRSMTTTVSIASINDNNLTSIAEYESSVSQDTVLTSRRKKYRKPHKPNRNGRIEVMVYENPRHREGVGRIGLCPCEDNWVSKKQIRNQEREIRNAARRQIKEERLKRKQKKISRKQAVAASHNGQCNYEKMNCFSHDNNHWRTVPFWNDGPFCVCMNANNNTYWCIRTLNATHNSLYCEFITGFVTYYDMKIDPYQLRNIAHTLTESELTFYHSTLERMRVCKGSDCFINTNLPAVNIASSGDILPKLNFPGKEIFPHDGGHIVSDR